MRVMVLGAGVIGTSSAYYLAKSGHEVVVVDRRSRPASSQTLTGPVATSPALPISAWRLLQSGWSFCMSYCQAPRALPYSSIGV